MTNEDALEILDIFRRHEWRHFFNHQLRIYIDEQVVKFYSTLHHENTIDMLIADITVKVCGELVAIYEQYGI